MAKKTQDDAGSNTALLEPSPENNDAGIQATADAAVSSDAAVHAAAEMKTVTVMPGDVIVHIVGKRAWFKGDETMRLNPERNLMGKAIHGFTYLEGHGAPHHNGGVEYVPIRRFFQPRQGFSGGDIPLLHADAPRQAMPQGTFNAKQDPLARVS